MPNEQNIQRIVAYIAQNRDQFDLDALREQLLAVGYSADDVAAAFARSEQPPQPETPPVPEAPQPVALSAAEPPPNVPAAPTQGDDQRVMQMITYLRQNAQAYNLNALRRQLIAQGEPPELVDVALARVRAETPMPEGRLRPALPWAGGALVLALIGTLLSLNGGLSGGFDWLGFGFVATLFYGGLGALMLLVGAVVQAFRRRTGLAMIFGGLIALALSAIAVVIFFGVCLVLIYSYGI